MGRLLPRPGPEDQLREETRRRQETQRRRHLPRSAPTQRHVRHDP